MRERDVQEIFRREEARILPADWHLSRQETKCQFLEPKPVSGRAPALSFLQAQANHMAIDERSERNIATLNPKVQPLARELIEMATAAGIHVKVIAGLRTYEQQDELYAQGRTLPGKIVTKAKGGQSNHNFGVAFDVGIFSTDSKHYFGESPDYLKVGTIGRSLGLKWGGDFQNFEDQPHFEFTNGRSLTQLKTAYEEHGDALA